MSWREALVFAAMARARVRLADGRTGTLVYAPGTRDGDEHAVRHGDRSKCGVRLDRVRTTGTVIAVDPTEIAEIINDRKGRRDGD